LIIPLWSLNEIISTYFSESHILIYLSSPPDAIILESGENYAHLTQLLCPVNEYWNFLSWTVHTLTVLSSDADNNSYPSVENYTLLTAAEWAFKAIELFSLMFKINNIP